jgi:hypothetical protein
LLKKIISSDFLKDSEISKFIKKFALGKWTDGPIYMMQPIVAFRDFANSSINCSRKCTVVFVPDVNIWNTFDTANLAAHCTE